MPIASKDRRQFNQLNPWRHMPGPAPGPKVHLPTFSSHPALAKGQFHRAWCVNVVSVQVKTLGLDDIARAQGISALALFEALEFQAQHAKFSFSSQPRLTACRAPI